MCAPTGQNNCVQAALCVYLLHRVLVRVLRQVAKDPLLQLQQQHQTQGNHSKESFLYIQMFLDADDLSIYDPFPHSHGPFLRCTCNMVRNY